jgi:hypothetical protein
MRLRDKVTSQGITYRAHVFNRSLIAESGGGSDGLPVYFTTNEQLTAIVEPKREWAVNNTLNWRGKSYRVTYVAVRRRRNRDHHYTLALETNT